jgi:hypothetical protein
MKMYRIMQRGKEVGAIYGTYNEARSLVRSRIRRSVKKGRTTTKGHWDFDSISRNPTSIKAYGYRIVAVS